MNWRPFWRIDALAAGQRGLPSKRANFEPHLAFDSAGRQLLTEGLEAVSTSINLVVSNLAVVESQARIVAGRKTLHHLLPNFVRPMGACLAGAFSGWSVRGPLTAMSRESRPAAAASQSAWEGSRTEHR